MHVVLHLILAVFIRSAVSGDCPCKNGGQCVNDVDGIWCQCPIEYEGPECEDYSKLARRILIYGSRCMHTARGKARARFQAQARGAQNVKSFQTREAFRGVSAFLNPTTFASQIGIPTFQALDCYRGIKNRFNLTSDQMRSIMRLPESLLKPNPTKVRADGRLPRPLLDMCPYPTKHTPNLCISSARYRSYDGSCNNLDHPVWGAWMQPLVRFLPQDYADGIGEPRRSKSGEELPSARAVSRAVFLDTDVPSNHHTSLVMTFGQLLAHDVVRTAISKISSDSTVLGGGEYVDVTCGDDGCDTTGDENVDCMPIEVTVDDSDFPSKTCLKFVRSQQVLPEDCLLGPREQLNQITAYLDASMVYGSDKLEAEHLRDFNQLHRGKLAGTAHPFSSNFKDLLPQDASVTACTYTDDNIKCFKAGDGRINVNTALAALHTVFKRMHNSIEDILSSIDQNRTGDELYLESRRIVGAAWQYIVYNEYLPLVLGTDLMNDYGLTLLTQGYYEGYNSTVNVQQRNGFSTAAFRFGHSQIDGQAIMARIPWPNFELFNLTTELFNPYHMYNVSNPGSDSPVDCLIKGQLLQPAQDVDPYFPKQVSAKLFSPVPPDAPGIDLPASNVQRGRDHGLPGYNAWRRWCSLSEAVDFDDFDDIPEAVADEFKDLYDDVDDVDLYAAGLAESHVSGGVVGPTFACIIARQFRSLRDGDRYWHELDDSIIGFTPGQLQEIRKFTMARILCDNLDHVGLIQPLVLLQENAPLNQLWNVGPFNDNSRIVCDLIPKPNLTNWSNL